MFIRAANVVALIALSSHVIAAPLQSRRDTVDGVLGGVFGTVGQAAGPVVSTVEGAVAPVSASTRVRCRC